MYKISIGILLNRIVLPDGAHKQNALNPERIGFLGINCLQGCLPKYLIIDSSYDKSKVSGK
ncbi:hypothetical protein BLOT_007873 [Blomia tropicalis]|nr:hypothetical protein BLOT_007873 [Blomia tropicalis]